MCITACDLLVLLVSRQLVRQLEGVEGPLHLALLDEGDVGDEGRDVEQRDATLP